MWIIPLLVVAIVLLIVIPVLLAVASVAALVIPWLILGTMVWMIFAVRRATRRRYQTRGRWVEHEPVSPAPARHRVRVREWNPSPARTLPARPPSDLPSDVEAQVQQIRRKSEVLLRYARRFPPLSQDLYIVRQTAADYLPRTVQTYLALPPASREIIIGPNGKTPVQELREQLGLLDDKLNEIALDLRRQDMEGLLANRRFLEERFGKTTV